MSFAPIEWVVSTLTPWHFAAWLAFTGLLGVLLPMTGGKPIVWSWLPFGLATIAIMYALFALALGQVFGDKYPAGTLWPSGFLMGAMVTSLPIFGAIVFSKDSASPPPIGFAIFAAFFGGNFFAFGLWLLPRVVGFGLFHFPKLTWGVHL